MTIDETGPGRGQKLIPRLDAYRRWRMGRITRDEVEHRLASPRLALDEEDRENREQEAEEATFAYDLAWQR